MEHKEYTVEVINIVRPTEYYINVSNWSKWEDNARTICNWLNANTELGDKGCFGTCIYFQTQKDLVWFKLVWGDDF